MARRKRQRDPDEERKLRKFVDRVSSREPRVKVYRKEPDNSLTPLTTRSLDGFSEEELRDAFGPGACFLRTIRSDGTFGPSCTLRLAPRPPGYL